MDIFQTLPNERSLYVKENKGDITKLLFLENINENNKKYYHDLKQIYSTNDEVILFTYGFKQLKTLNSHEQSNLSSFIIKSNGIIIETEYENTLNIINYHSA